MLSLREIPIKNLRTHPVRTVILFVLTLAQAACVFGGIMMMLGMRQELARAQARLGADVLVYPTAAESKISMKSLLMQGTPVEVYRDRSMLDKMEYCDGISAVTHQIYISDTAADGSKIWIYGYEPETDFVISPWLENEKDIQTPAGSVILGSKVVAENNMITLYRKDWPVAARLEETGSSLDTSVFVCMDTLRELIKASKEAGTDTYASVNPDKQFSSAPVRVIDKSKVGSVTDWINIYVRKVTAVRSEETLTQASSGIQSTTKMLAVIAAVAWLVLLAALGIMQSMLMKERTGELHVWQAIGASRRIVNRVMLSEAFLVHLAGAVAGTILAGIGFLLFGKGYPTGGILAAVFAAVVVTVAAGLFSAWLALKKASKKLSGQMLLT